jgi:DNA mismatch repair protein MutS2
MAQSGLHIPASADSVLPIFAEVFVDLGDEQSLQQNLSTFSAHLMNIRTIMHQVTEHSLVLLDELGAGTDPLEGGPLGVAILAYLQQQGAKTLATTHHGVIKAFAMSTPDIMCAAVDFDLETLAPRYQLVYGLPGRSQAFAIAQKLGLPEAVLERARQEAGMTQLRSEQLLARLEAQQYTLEAERRQLDLERVEIARLHADAQQAVAQAHAEEQRIRQSLFTEGQALLKGARQELDATLAALRRQEPAAAVAFPQEAWQRMEQAVTALQPVVPEAPAALRPLLVGDTVRVRGLNLVGRLRTPVAGGGAVHVEVGGKTITVAVSELERSATPYEEAPAATPPAWRRARRQAPAAQEVVGPELRLLGSTVAEALPVLDKYLDQAVVQGLQRLRIVHGVGSGRLREAVTDFLGRHPQVRRFHAGDASGGTTIVELEG